MFLIDIILFLSALIMISFLVIVLVSLIIAGWENFSGKKEGD